MRISVKNVFTTDVKSDTFSEPSGVFFYHFLVPTDEFFILF